MPTILGIALGILVLAIINDMNHPRGGGTAIVCG